MPERVLDAGLMKALVEVEVVYLVSVWLEGFLYGIVSFLFRNPTISCAST
jgi:hypothetical protein